MYQQHYYSRFAAHQWLSLVGIIWLQSINGTNFNFPSYSSQLKQILSLSQLQVNNLAFASDAGKLFGWFSGVAAIYLPLWLVLMIGSTLGLIGYGVQYLFITNQLHYSLSYWHIFTLSVLAGNSICWINTVCYIVAIRNFPSNRQTAVGISTSYQGLSAKIYTDIVDSIFSTSSSKRAKAFLFLNSVLPLAVCFMAAPLARNRGDLDSSVGVGEYKRDLETGFIAIFVITILTGIFAVMTSINIEGISNGLLLSPLVCLVGILIFLVVPVVIPGVEYMKKRFGYGEMNKERSKSRSRRVCDFTVTNKSEVEDEIEIKLPEIIMEDSDRKMGMGSSEREVGMAAGELRWSSSVIMEEIGVKTMLKRINFWLYVFVYFCGATIGLVFLNNLGQIAESRRSSNIISSLVSLSSSFGFFGRLIPSILDHFCSRSEYMISKPASLVALMGAMCGSFFLLLSPTNLALYTSTAMIALCCGAITSIAVSTTTELFGMDNFSINHNVVIANIPFGSFIFGYLAAFLYHKQAQAQSQSQLALQAGIINGRCIGVECYRTSFFIWGCVCVFGTLLALALFLRTRSFYSSRKFIT